MRRATRAQSRNLRPKSADAYVREILSDIGLEVAEEKTGVRGVSEGFEFLGFSFGRSLRPRPRALSSFKDRVRSCTRRKAPISMAVMIKQLNPVLRGWGNYFAQGDVISLFEDLDRWIRMRLRSKARRRGKANGGRNNQLWPNRRFAELGLVSLECLARAARLSPA